MNQLAGLGMPWQGDDATSSWGARSVQSDRPETSCSEWKPTECVTRAAGAVRVRNGASEGGGNSRSVALGYAHWNRERVLTCVRAWIAMTGQPPRLVDFNGGGWPTPDTVKRHCGSWGSALRSAYLLPGQLAPSSSGASSGHRRLPLPVTDDGEAWIAQERAVLPQKPGTAGSVPTIPGTLPNPSVVAEASDGSRR